MSVRRACALAALSTVLFGAGCPSSSAPPQDGGAPTTSGLSVRLSLAQGFNSALVTGLEVFVERAPGGPALGLSPRAARMERVGDLSFTSAQEVGPSGEVRWVARFAGNPLGGGASVRVPLQLEGAPAGVPVSVRVDVLGARGVLGVLSLASRDDGTRIVYQPTGQDELVAHVACARFVSCTAGLAGNRPPTLASLSASTAPQRVRRGVRWQFALDAFDPDGDPLSLDVSADDLEDLPGEATYDAPSRTVSWTPGESSDEVHTLRVSVSDGRGGRDERAYKFVVVEGAPDPLWTPSATRLVAEGRPHVQPLTVLGEGLTFEVDVQDLPDGASATFDEATRSLRWTPRHGDARDTPYVVRVLARDAGGGETALPIPLWVVDANEPPLLAGPVAVAVRAGVTTKHRFMGADPEADALTMSAALGELSAVATFDGPSGVLSVTPTAAQVRDAAYPIAIVARDGRGGAARLDLAVRVVQDNGSPIVTLPTPAIVNERDNITLQLSALDPDAEVATLAFDAVELPTGHGAAFDAAAGRLAYTPALGVAREWPYLARFAATDARGAVTQVVSPMLVRPLRAPNPRVPDLLAISPAGPANDNEPIVRGTGQPGMRVRLFDGARCRGDVLGEGAVEGNGELRVVARVPDDRTVRIHGRTVSPDGRLSRCSTSFVEYTEDSAPPEVPLLESTLPASPANQNNPLVQGLATPGIEVLLYTNGECLGTPQQTGRADSAGRFGLGAAVADDSTTVFAVAARDAAGNRSACSSSLVYVEDSRRPETPILTGTLPVSPANDNAPLVLGRATPGLRVRLFQDPACAMFVVETLADAAGEFRVRVNVPDNSLTHFFAQAYSAVGTGSLCSAGVTYREDSDTPDPPRMTGTVPTSPSRETRVTVLGITRPSATVQLYRGGDCAGPVGEPGIANVSGQFAIAVTVLQNFSTTFYARATDPSGSITPCAREGVVYVHDSAPPLAPTALSTSPLSPANNNTPDVIGTAEPLSTVFVYVNPTCSGAPAGSGPTDLSGAFRVPVTVPNNSSTTYFARAVDGAGNASVCSSASVTYLENSEPPAVPTFTGTTPESPSRTSTNPIVRGIAQPGSEVRLYAQPGCAGAVLASGLANTFRQFSIGATVASNSTTRFYATASDDQGNTSGCTTEPLTFIHDSVAPPAPTLLASTPQSPSRSVRTPRIEGSAEALALVALFTDEGCAGAEVAAGAASLGGVFSLTVNVAANSTTRFYGRATDTAGNVSGCSTLPLGYVHDDIAPAPPAPSGSVPPSPSNVNTPRVTGLAEPRARVRLYADGACAGALAGEGDASETGAFSLSVVVADNSSTAFFGTATDASGNTSACSGAVTPALSYSYVEDSTPPAAPVGLSTVPTSPANQNRPEVVGRAEVLGRVALHTTPDCSGAPRVEGAVDLQGNFRVAVDVADNTFTTFYARVTDSAGNPSPCSSGVPYFEDSAAPLPPVFTGSTPGSPSRLTTSPVVAGTTEAGATVRLYRGVGCSGAPVATLVSQGGTFSVALAVDANASTTFTATSTDVSGNTSACSPNPLVFVHDNVAPPAPTVATSQPASPSRVSTQPLISGTAEPGSVVRLYTQLGCGGGVAGFGNASAEGAYTVQATVAPNSTARVFATATDAAGNTSPCSPTSLPYVHDNRPPNPPVLTATSPASPSRSVLTPTVTGTAEPGAAIAVYSSATCNGTPSGVAVADGQGAFTVAVTVPPDTTTSLHATATDIAGNTSGCGDARTYTHDATAPSPPTLSGTAPRSPSGNRNPRVLGAAEPGAIVRVYPVPGCTGGATGTGVADAEGRFDVPATAFENQLTPFSANATDLAGNSSPCSVATLPFLHDALAPAAPAFTASEPASPSRESVTPLLSGTADPSAMVLVYLGGSCSGALFTTASADSEGHFSAPVTVDANSATTFSAESIDDAGNLSNCSLGFTYVHDNLPPPAPTGLSSTPLSPSNDNRPRVRGSATTGSTVRLYATPGCTGAPLATTAAAAGAFEAQVTLPENALSVLRATATDAAGNTSACSTASVNYLEDSTPPNAPSLSGTQPPSPSSTTASPEVQGGAEAGATVRVFTTADCSGLPAASTVANASGAYSVSVSARLNASTSFFASASDAAGNASSCSTTSVTYVHDTLAPAEPVLLSSLPASPSGFSTTPVISGTAEPGTLVRLYVSPTCGGAAIGQGTVAEGGTFDIGSTVAANSTTAIYGRASDAAGNVSPCSATSVVFIHDTTVPPTPAGLTITPSSPANENSPSVLGSAPPLSTVRVYPNADCSGAPVGSAQATGGGAFSVRVTVSDDSTTTFRATATDRAGNTSPCSTSEIVYVEDSTAPASATLTSSLPTSPSRTVTPTLRGVTEPSATVRLYTAAGCAGPVAGSTTAGLSGTFALVVTVAQNATTLFYARSTDAAGNASPCSATPFPYMHDSGPPETPIVTGTTPASPTRETTSPIVRGTTEAGARVFVYNASGCSSGLIGSGLADSAGAFAIQIFVVSNSITTLYARAVDQADNASSCSTNVVTYAHDNTPPPAPVITGSAPASPSRSSTTPSLSGTAEAGSVVRVYTNAACSGATVATGIASAGTFSLAVSVPAESLTAFHATATDAVGNVSSCSPAPFTYVHDATPPVAPALLGSAPPSPANNNAPNVTGSAEPGTTVRLFTTGDCGGSPVGTGPSVAGTFSIAVSVPDDSVSTFYATATDAAGNTSQCSLARAIYIEDSTAPPAPMVSGTTPLSPSATSTTPTVSGSAEPNATVRIYGSPGCAGNALATGTAGSTGAFDVLTTVPANTVSTLFATAADAAGNVSACSLVGRTYIHDDAPPPAPTGLASTPASPANNNNPTITGQAEAGATVRLYASSSCQGQPIATTTSAGGAFSAAIVVGDDTTTAVRATATDASGNTSPCSSPLTFVEDSTPPSRPVFSGVSPVSPSRTSITPTLSGAAEPGATVRLYRASDCSGTQAGQGVAAAGGTFAIGVTVSANATASFWARATDVAGNSSPCSTSSLSYTHDDAPPAAPAFTASTPAPPSNTSTSPVLLGNAEALATVRVYTLANCIGGVVATGNASAAGAFSITAPAGENTGTSYFASATDAAGNVSACSSTAFVYVHDNQPPSIPTGVAVAPASPANNNAPTLSGQAEANATARLFASSTCTGSPVVTGPVTSGGAFTLTATVANDSTTTFRVNVMDAAGNVSPCSQSVTYVEDSTPPDAPVFGPSTPPSPSATSTTPVVRGTAEPSARVRLFTQAECAGAEVASALADSNGAFSIAVTVSANSVTRFYARASDAASNTSACTSIPFTYIHDDAAPLAPVLTATSPPSPSNTSTSPTLTGTSEANATLRIFTNPACSGTPAVTSAVSGAGTFSVVVTVPPNNSTTLYAQAVDVAGNASPCSGGRAYIHDSQPPSSPAVTASSPVSPSRVSTTPTLSGQAEPSSTVRVYANASCSGALLATSTASAAGAFTAAVALPANTASSVYATATDAAGNVSQCTGAAFVYVHDATAPAAATGLGSLPASPANNNAPAIFGTAEAGATAELFSNGACSGSPVATGLVLPSGTFSLVASVANDSSTSFSVRLTDPAGNVSGCSAPVTYVEDSTAPNAPALVSTTPTSPAGSSTTPLIQGTAEAGATVRLYSTVDCSGSVVGNGVANQAGSFSIQVSVASQSSATFRATATDPSGNSSACTTTSITYTHDSIAPATPTITAATPASPSNGVTTPTLSGAAEAFATVRLFATSNCSGSPIGTAVATMAGMYTATAQITPNQTTFIRAQATDAAGNHSGCSQIPFTYVHDNVPPAAPTELLLTPASPSATPTPTLVGSAESGALVRVFANGTCAGSAIASATASGQGSFGIALSVPLNATTTYSLRATDAASNDSLCSQSIAYTHDDVVPAAPNLASTSPATTPAAPAPVLCPTLSGTAEPNSVVELYRSACAGAPEVSLNADGAGAFGATLCVSDNTTTFYARARDAAANTSVCSQPLAYYFAPQYPLTLTRLGGGSVVSSPTGIDCGSTCAASFTSGTTVTLTATVPTGYTFGGFSGDCASTAGLTCTVDVSNARNVTVTFVNVIPRVDPVAIGGSDAVPCATVGSNTGRKVALDAARNVYAAMVCGGVVQVAVSAPSGSQNNVGQTWNSPGTVGVSSALDAELLGGSSGVAYLAVLQHNTTSDARVVFVRTTDAGASWSSPVVLAASGASRTWGVSVASVGSSVLVAASVSNQLRVWRAGSQGAGAFTSTDVPRFTTFGDVRVEPTTGKVYALGDTFALHIFESGDGGATFGAEQSPVGAGALESDWAVAAGFVFVSGSDSVYRIALATPTVAVNLGGFATTAPARERGLDASPNGTLYVTTRGDPAQSAGPVYLERVLPGATAASGLRTLVAADGEDPSVVAGPGDNVAIVVFTTQNRRVFATVQPY